MIEIVVIPLTSNLPLMQLFGAVPQDTTILAEQTEQKARLGNLLDMGFRLFDGREVKDAQGSALVYILYKPSPPPAPEVETL